MSAAKRIAFAALAVGLVVLAYSNHFANEFHFDDRHTITDNPAIRSLANVPRFFTDSTTFSLLPTHQVYRPLLTAKLPSVPAAEARRDARGPAVVPATTAAHWGKIAG